jgi:pyruvate-ferredoxin/flavodoxin oxidoreductase
MHDKVGYKDVLGKDKSVKNSQFAHLYSSLAVLAQVVARLRISRQLPLYGDRMIVANATAVRQFMVVRLLNPYCANSEGRGPAWANSLFEDNAEYGFGIATGLRKCDRIAQKLNEGLNAGLAESTKRLLKMVAEKQC